MQIKGVNPLVQILTRWMHEEVAFELKTTAYYRSVKLKRAQRAQDCRERFLIRFPRLRKSTVDKQKCSRTNEFISILWLETSVNELDLFLLERHTATGKFNGD